MATGEDNISEEVRSQIDTALAHGGEEQVGDGVHTLHGAETGALRAERRGAFRRDIALPRRACADNVRSGHVAFVR